MLLQILSLIGALILTTIWGFNGERMSSLQKFILLILLAPFVIVLNFKMFILFLLLDAIITFVFYYTQK